MVAGSTSRPRKAREGAAVPDLCQGSPAAPPRLPMHFRNASTTLARNPGMPVDRRPPRRGEPPFRAAAGGDDGALFARRPVRSSAMASAAAGHGRGDEQYLSPGGVDAGSERPIILRPPR